jgi:hypothetical protein
MIQCVPVDTGLTGADGDEVEDNGCVVLCDRGVLAVVQPATTAISSAAPSTEKARARDLT